MKLVHRVQGFDKVTEALEYEYVVPLRLVASVREVLGEPEDPDDDPGVLPLTVEMIQAVRKLTGFALDPEHYDWFLDVAEAEFEIAVNWPTVDVNIVHDQHSASFGETKILVSGTNVTEWKSAEAREGFNIDIPLYDATEWVARNWWALLYEPQKGEQRSQGYRRRHWLSSAQHGFALPDLWISPAGTRAEIRAKRTTLPYANPRFVHSAECSLEREALRDQLASFVETVLERMDTLGVRQTDAHTLWRQVCQTRRDQEAYCRLVGALGLSPYDDNGPLKAAISRLTERYDPALMLDLCQAADTESMGQAIELVEGLTHTLTQGRAVDLSKLGRMAVPADVPARPWERGVSAAAHVRESLGISPLDPQAATAVFDKMAIDTRLTSAGTKTGDDESRISAAIQKCAHSEMLMALVQSGETARRFAAARSIFFGILAGDSGSRLVTIAKTRDQKASRAFSAEIVVPFEFINLRNKGSRTIRTDCIKAIADEVVCSPKTVLFQARNNGLRVADRVGG